MKKVNMGFTLIELMIVVAIIAILAVVAYGSYSDSLIKSRRADAKEALTRAAVMEEKHHLQAKIYTIDETLIGGDTSTEGYYSISAAYTLDGFGDCAVPVSGSPSGDEGQCFTVTATPQGAQAEDTTCATLTIDNLGRKRAEDSGGNSTESTCW